MRMGTHCSEVAVAQPSGVEIKFSQDLFASRPKSGLFGNDYRFNRFNIPSAGLGYTGTLTGYSEIGGVIQSRDFAPPHLGFPEGA